VSDGRAVPNGGHGLKDSRSNARHPVLALRRWLTARREQRRKRRSRTRVVFASANRGRR